MTILEPKEGGDVQFTFLKDKSDKSDKHLHKLDKDYHVVGKITKIVPNKELFYTWNHKDIPDFPETIVSWQLERLDKNKTKLILTHTWFTDKDKKEYDSHTEGWSWFIRKLQNYLAKGDNRQVNDKLGQSSNCFINEWKEARKVLLKKKKNLPHYWTNLVSNDEICPGLQLIKNISLMDQMEKKLCRIFLTEKVS